MCSCWFESYLVQCHSRCGDALVVRPLTPWLVNELAGGPPNHSSGIHLRFCIPNFWVWRRAGKYSSGEWAMNLLPRRKDLRASCCGGCILDIMILAQGVRVALGKTTVHRKRTPSGSHGASSQNSRARAAVSSTARTPPTCSGINGQWGMPTLPRLLGKSTAIRVPEQGQQQFDFWLLDSGLGLVWKCGWESPEIFSMLSLCTGDLLHE